MAKKIAVTGTGRSGTNFFAAVLSELGKDVSLNENFIVGHQVRYPLKTIGSLTIFNKTSWRYISENSPERPKKIMHRFMAHWLDWNSRAVDLASFNWKLKDIEVTAPEILEVLGWGVIDEVWAEAYIKAKHGAISAATRVSDSLFKPRFGPITQWRRFKENNRKSLVTWDALRAIDSGLTQEIQVFAHSLVYDI